jgi:hypothetical protein
MVGTALAGFFMGGKWERRYGILTPALGDPAGRREGKKRGRKV